ncbi:MAG: hypothetical protein IKF82_07165 [Bacilli bacterium]|nr:hypothetical protein [Bacilli bacterium]
MTKHKRKVKLGRILILLFILSLLVGVCIYGSTKVSKKSSTVKKVKAISSIEKYDYTLKENATAYYKGLYKELEKILNNDEVSYDDYLEVMCKMFVADFFNLDNKSSKNDVGGVEFVYKDYQLDFKKYAMDSIYKTVENNVYGARKQELPIVSEVSVEKVKNDSYKLGDTVFDEAYVVNFDISYKSDLGYQNSGSLTVIKKDNKLEIVSMKDAKA